MFGVGFGFVASIAKHETLVARTLFVNGLHHAAVDVGRLAGDELSNFAKLLGGGVHADAVRGVADGSGRLASDGDVVGSVNAGCEFDLPGQHDVRTVLSPLHERLNGHLGLGVEGQTRIDDGVGNGVAQLVGVACRHRFGREQPSVGHVARLFASVYEELPSRGYNVVCRGNRVRLDCGSIDARRRTHVPTV